MLWISSVPEYVSRITNRIVEPLLLTSITTARGIAGRYPISPSVLYATAAVIAPSIVPYTIAVMGPTTLTPLEARATGASGAPGDQETLDLIKKWSGQNTVRAGMVGTAAVMSALAILAQVA